MSGSGRHRTLLFRSYFFLVAGLLIVASVLDYGFGRLQRAQTDPADQWVAATFGLIEARLAALPESNRDTELQRLREQLGLEVSLLPNDAVAAASQIDADFEVLEDASGRTVFLRQSLALGGHLRLAPMTDERESLLLKLLPPIFYLSIFVIVGLWLRPLFRDLNLITAASQRFAADYREPLETAADTSELTALASNLDDMSARLSGLIQSQKELIAALSHEMRTPLARIRMALAVAGDGDAGIEQLTGIVKDVDEVDRLIATMLSYARLDHPDLRMNWQEVPVAAWLTRVAGKCRRPDKTLTINRDEAIDAAPMDPRLMELALSNLLTNAGRYGQSEARCGFGLQDGSFRITVEDDGSGIPESERDAVFKAFSRLDDSRNRDTGGFGLGLAIVSRIAGLHGGSVEVDASHDLGGARFRLRWPDGRHR